MKILAIDLGKVRTGLAVSDVGEVLASPLCVITENNPDILAEKIHQICKKENISKIILGLPKNMNGSNGESALYSKNFGQLLQQQIQIPIVLLDERGTTITAHNYLNEINVRGQKRKNIVDTVAATIILQNYLDAHR